jgi:hypothetical protein
VTPCPNVNGVGALSSALPIYREFRMGSKTWPIATFVVVLIAVGAGVYALTQYSSVTDLTAQLTVDG